MLIERENSLQMLRAASLQANSGQGSIVIVSGEAGIGKTTLLQEFGRNIQGNTKILWGGCEPLFTARPLGPLHDMAYSIDESIRTLFEQGAAQDRLFPAVLNALQSMRHSSILIFEDVHWADNATLDFIKYIGRRIALLGVNLVLSLRSDEVGNNHPLSQVLGDLPSNLTARIELQPLSPEGVSEMAKAIGRSSSGLHQITAGNPFFVTELLAQSENTQSRIPASVRDAVWARISRLSSKQRKILELVSISPGSIELTLVKAVLGTDVELGVQRCTEQGILQLEELGQIRFRHELARLAMLEQISADQQVGLHEQISEAMSDAVEAGSTFGISRQMHHAAGARNAAKILAIAPLAAADAARLGAHQQAAAHLETGLKYTNGAPKELVAQLNEDWAYEAGLAVGISDETIAARTRAVTLWRDLNNSEKIALNLRWLSRMHWYRGESKTATEYLDQALKELENLPPSRELAMALSARAQFHMLHEQNDEAIIWGLKTITLAEELGELEPRVHALNTTGIAMLRKNRSEGEAKIEESLALALKHGFHEQAARAYTNYSGHAVQCRQFALAEKILSEGIAFDSAHDLDSWTHYLIGVQAQLRLDQSRFREAETIANGVLGIERLTLLMKLPARQVLGKSRIRLGKVDGLQVMEKTLQDALATGEQQYIAPAHFAMVEATWLDGKLDEDNLSLNELLRVDTKNFDLWDRGELAVWLHRCKLEIPFAISSELISAPRWAELQGDISKSSALWTELGLPYEAALVLLQSSGETAADNIQKAITILEGIEARPAVKLARQIATRLGVADRLSKPRRGPYAAARRHPLGLTQRELQIAGFIVEGLGNVEVSRRIVRSQRTVEHHVSSILEKLNAKNRFEILLRLRNEPWLLPVEFRTATVKN